MDTIALILSIIGSLNWGLVGIFKFDLIAWIFGGQTAVVSRILYTSSASPASGASACCSANAAAAAKADPAARTAPALRPSVPSTEGPLCTRCSAQAHGSPERGAVAAKP